MSQEEFSRGRPLKIHSVVALAVGGELTAALILLLPFFSLVCLALKRLEDSFGQSGELSSPSLASKSAAACSALASASSVMTSCVLSLFIAAKKEREDLKPLSQRLNH